MAKVQVQFGGKGGRTFDLETNEDLVVVRTRDSGPVEEASLSAAGRRVLTRMEPMVRFQTAGVEVFHVRSGSQGDRDTIRTTLKAEPAIRFAGRVLADPVYKPAVPWTTAETTPKEPVLYSENLFVKFADGHSGRAARSLLSARGLTVKREVDYLDNAYFVAAPEGTGLKVFAVALEMLRKEPGVEFCHPELLRPREFRKAFRGQWHLQKTKVAGVTVDAGANVVRAWKHTKGAGVVIAVIDTGTDIDHEEFASAGKIVAARDATPGVVNPNDPRPQLGNAENHGTACAGVACADGARGASGVAPAAKLMPIRLMAGLGSQGEADAFAWAADHKADVISCSWGPIDGRWFKADDPAHRAFTPIPDNTRLAVEYAASKGRGGKGCVICWAAGNGNESVDNDGYASHPDVVAVAACNDSSKRSVYSDTGKALWCAFPSDDADLQAVKPLPNPPPVGGVWDKNHPAPKTPGIWTTDRSGKRGYNQGGAQAAGDVAGHYTNSFGGTSSATPGVAGVVALVLSLNKNLTVKEVKDVLRRACDRIDVANGAYDPATGHSPLYGYGRLNAEKAVKLAVAAPIVPAGGGGAPDATRRRSGGARRGAAAGGGKSKGRRRPARASSGKSRRGRGGKKRRRSS